MHIVQWSVRWVFWLYLVLKDTKEWSDYSASLAAVYCVAGMLSLIAPWFVVDIFHLHSIDIFATFVVGTAMYLLFGLMLYFEFPNSNMKVRWTENGPW